MNMKLHFLNPWFVSNQSQTLMHVAFLPLLFNHLNQKLSVFPLGQINLLSCVLHHMTNVCHRMSSWMSLCNHDIRNRCGHICYSNLARACVLILVISDWHQIWVILALIWTLTQRKYTRSFQERNVAWM